MPHPPPVPPPSLPQLAASRRVYPSPPSSPPAPPSPPPAPPSPALRPALFALPPARRRPRCWSGGLPQGPPVFWAPHRNPGLVRVDAAWVALQARPGQGDSSRARPSVASAPHLPRLPTPTAASSSRPPRTRTLFRPTRPLPRRSVERQTVTPAALVSRGSPSKDPRTL